MMSSTQRGGWVCAFCLYFIIAAHGQTVPSTLPSPPAPILEGHNADPDVRVFGDTYYIYPTSDKPFWNTTDFSCWSSKDLIHWTNQGIILDVTKDLKWAHIKAWAPGVAQRNGKYYFYFGAESKTGVAVSDKPTGPFVDALGQPLLTKTQDMKTNPFDPFPFIDDDGQAYLYFGNGKMYAVKLKPDMITLDGDPVLIPARNFREGSVVFKRKGVYYFMWSENDARSDDYRIGYGTGDSPLGPIKVPANNVILKKRGLAKGTGHHSVLNVPGTDRWYIVYHRHAIPNGDGYTRETCLSRMQFAADGSIEEVDPLAGVFPPGSVGEPIVNGHGLADPDAR